ncbi:MAG: Gfo/Idh/MocA family oxidoreductase [bacterium]|nr:Gfo/Idh/MocA family oxidoreductase [bacterium]
MKTRYVQVGIGGRSYMFSDAIVHKFPAYGELVAICDINPGRMMVRNRRFAEGDPVFPDYPKVPPVMTYAADEFDLMLRKEKPDTVIVTTMDSWHDYYVVRALEAGCDVICEKPLTIDAHRLQDIIDAVNRTGKRLRVTFNCRYSPVRSRVKELIREGIIGDILSVDFCWNLNVRHGADYFRRWHRHKGNSGGLLVHKATHHFDLANWWLEAVPVEVFCKGHRRFYTPEQAERYGLTNRKERCLECPEKEKCAFHLDLSGNPGLRELYLEQEGYDGYYRDRCVFSPDMDIEDSMNAVVTYDSGAVMSYALNAFTPWEGYSISFNGNKGRLEHNCVESIYINGDGQVPGELLRKGTSIVVHPHFGEQYSVPVPEAKGGHGGGDEPLLADLFDPSAPEDPLKRAAGLGDGACSILIGIAANESMRTGVPVRISDLVTEVPVPSWRK